MLKNILSKKAFCSKTYLTDVKFHLLGESLIIVYFCSKFDVNLNGKIL